MNLRVARWCSLLLTLTVGLFFAGPALALYYIDMADSSELGYVADGGSITWDHQFEPAEAVDSVQHTYLVITVTEDFVCDSFGQCMTDVFFQEESVIFDVVFDGTTTEWDGGDVTPGWIQLGTIFAGEVSVEAHISEWGDSMTVIARSDTDNGGGDFMVVNSSMIVDFTPDDLAEVGGGATPMPEPSAALVFALGGMVFSGGMRGQRRR